ncbi:MAG: lysylphosphatidylglycerol synthase transmembrane domain-containing protein [Thermodesulfobacteriota bacterium]
MPSLLTRRLRVFVPLAVSALILYLLLVKIDTGRIVESLRTCDIRLVGLAAVISLGINVLFGAEKWRRILSALGCDLPYREVLAIRTGCIPFKILLPFKSSELLKAYYLDRSRKLSFTRATSSLILDKAMNLLVLIPLAIIGLSVVDIPFIKAALLLILSLILLAVYSDRFRQGLAVVVAGIVPRLHGTVNGLLSGFAEVRGSEKTILIVYSLVYQLSEFVNTFILLKAVGVAAPFAYLMVIVPVIMIINNLPITALGLGTREMAIVYFLKDFGPSASLFSGGILISLVEYVLPVLVGILFIRSFQRYAMIKKQAS